MGVVCDRMSNTRVLRYCWCTIIILNAYTQTEEKTNDEKGTFYDELEKVLIHFLSTIKNLLGDFNVRVGSGVLSNRQLAMRDDSNDNGVRNVNFITSKNLIVTRTMFEHRNFRKYT